MSNSNHRSRTWAIGLALIFVTLAIYWPVKGFDFVQYDDDEYVFQNSTVMKGLKWEGVVWSVVDAHAANWHPVTLISHMLDCQLFGLNPGWHHAVNVLLHAVNSLLLFLLLRSMTGRIWSSAFVAALFAWHPLRVESVAWISERKDVLSGFFFMGTLWAYALYVQRQGAKRFNSTPTSKSWREWMSRPSFSYGLSLVMFAFGLLSKPMLVTVPFVLLLIDLWPLNRFQGEAMALRWRKMLREKIPYFALAAVAGSIAFFAQKSGGAMSSLASLSVADRLANAAAGYLGYLGKLLWPAGLSVLYLRPAVTPGWSVLGGLLVLAGVSVVVLKNLGRRPYLVVGWFWFVVMLLPVSGVIQIGLQSIADRYTYLPAIGLGLMLTWGIQELAAAVRSERGRSGLMIAMASAVLIAYAVWSRHQLGFWQNSETLMGRALELDPNNYVAHQNLGVYYTKLGRTDLARAHRQRVRELDPVLRQQILEATNLSLQQPETK
jgi:protein O-mannosyl-transferase